jgi:uncharacterized membrane protein
MSHVITAQAAQKNLDLFAKTKPARISSIDLLRGFIMIIMALDHTRDFFHTTAWTDDPLNLATTTPWLYFTRWITHLCAPNFVFLAGVAVYFQHLRKTKKQLSTFLIKRGLWLIFVEIFIVNLEFSFDIQFGFTALQVIWAIGVSMIILGLLIWLPFTAIFIIGAVIVLGHNSLDYYEVGLEQQPPIWYSLLHQSSEYKISENHKLLVFYPFLPWTGLMLLGYCFGKLFLQFEGSKRKRMLLVLGCSLLLLFDVFRYLNGYGDPLKWSAQKDGLYTFFSFMKVQKYPPSLLYMCATIGLAMLFLVLTQNVNNRITRFITVYGRVPFTYYVLHFFLIHLAASILFLARGHSIQEGIHHSQIVPNFVKPGEGVSLGIVYLIWICIVLLLYPICKWFSEYKRHHKDWWLSYI